MSGARANPRITRKHMAKAQRDRILSRWVMGGAITVGVVVVGLVAFAFLGAELIEARQPIATINGEIITVQDYKARVRLVQLSMINEYQYSQNILQIYADEPSLSAYYQQRLEQLTAELDSPFSQGQQALQELMDEILMRQEANQRGIFISAEEIDTAVAEQDFRYFRDGTPTPQPSPTVDPTALAAITPSATPAEADAGTPTQSPTAVPTATAFTEEAFLADYAERMEFFEGIGIGGEDYLSLFETALYKERLIAVLEAELPLEEDQVWMRHVLMADIEGARAVKDRLADGEAWEDLVAELSQDFLTSSAGGDLGWLGSGDIASRFGEVFGTVAFSIAVGGTSGPVQSDDGWHIIQILGHEVQTLSDATLDQRLQEAYQNLLSSLTADAEIDVDENWPDFTPHAYDLAREVVP